VRRARAAFGVVVAIAAAGGCDDADITPPIEIQYGAAASTILSPFPSDRYTVADPTSPTGLRVKIDAQTTADPLVTTFPGMVKELALLDGFSTLGGVALTFSGPLDIRGLTTDPKAEPPITDPPRAPDDYKNKDSPLFLIDVDPASPQKGTLFGLVTTYAHQDPDSGLAVDYTLVAQPSVPLRQRTRYLFCAMRSLKAKSGGGVQPSAEMFRVLGGPPRDDYEKKLGDALAVFETATGHARADVAVATVFTTESVTGELARAAQAARARPAPSQPDPWTVEKPLQPDGRVRFRGTFSAVEYRDPQTGTWTVDAGSPKDHGVAKIEAFLAFTQATTKKKRPVVIFQHGLGGDKDGTWGTAERLAELGVAVIGIDSPEHGSRSKAPSGDQLASIEAFLGVDVEKRTFDIARARDNFW
jgi:hypothetical protein